MKVLYLTIGDARNPGTRLRVHAIAPLLRARGHDVEVRAPLGAGLRSRLLRRALRPLDLARDLRAAGAPDVVVIYRKTFPPPFAAWLRARFRRIAFEFDDAIWLPAPAEPQGPEVERRYRRNFDATVAVADLVLAGNRTLAAAAVGAAEVLPTAVDLRRFDPALRRTRPGAFVVGWLGTAENLPQWQALAPVLRRLQALRPEVRFKVVSDRPPPDVGLPIEFERFTLAREAACLAEMDAALMPLADTPWNRGKCSAKALQAMAMALPVVISPVGMNREVVEPGVNGLFAAGEDEWLGALAALAADRPLGERLGQAARRTVEERYDLAVVGARAAVLLERLAAAG